MVETTRGIRGAAQPRPFKTYRGVWMPRHFPDSSGGWARDLLRLIGEAAGGRLLREVGVRIGL